MLRTAFVFALLGLAAAIGLIVWQGYDDVLRAFSAAGWGILWSSLFHLVPMVIAARAWQVLVPARRTSLRYMTFVLWIRAAVNNLMPVARIGGEIVAARLMIKSGWQKHRAVASVVVETTISVVTVFALIVTGIILLATRDPDTPILMRLVICVLVSLPVVVALVLIQKIGIFGLLSKVVGHIGGQKWQGVVSDTNRLDRAVRTLYLRLPRIAESALWMLMAWFMGAGYIWLCFYFLGTPRSWTDCLIVEAMIQLTSSLAFAVPAALGAQEGAYVLLGQILGFSPETALAMALLRRVRDLLLYVPGLIVWQGMEGRWLLNKKAN